MTNLSDVIIPITNLSYINTYFKNAAIIRGVKIPRRHPRIDPIDILLGLKPPEWRLKRFHEHMKCLRSCSLGGLGSKYRGRMFEMALYQEEIFFCLDKNLNKDDIIYLLNDLIRIPLTTDLPRRFTGESLVRGELANFVTPRDYGKVVTFIDYSRRKFSQTVDLVAFFVPRDTYDRILASKLNIPIGAKSMTMAQSLYPNMLLTENRSNLDAILVQPIRRGLHDYTNFSKDQRRKRMQ